MDETARLSLVAIAMASGATLDAAFEIVDRLPEDLPAREAAERVAASAREGAWGKFV